MPVKLIEPHAKRERGNETIPLWRYPHCRELKTMEEFGFRFRRDAYKKVNMWHKQAWCRECRARSWAAASRESSTPQATTLTINVL